jgi:hypothetical protein
MTNHIAPQEDEFRLPANWAKLVLPRRGRDNPDVAIDPDAPGTHRERVRLHEPGIRRALERDENRDWAADVEAALAGEPNPRGAAAVAALLPTGGFQRPRPILRPALDAWTADFGLAFATAAAVERLSLTVDRLTDPEHRNLSDGLSAFPHPLLEDLGQGIRFLRGLLAAASDETYTAAVAAVAPLRHEPVRRMAAAVLLPEETDWTDEASIDYGQHQDWGWSNLLFWNWVRSPEQLAASTLTRLHEAFIDAAAVAAIVDGLGPASLPVLAATLEHARPNANDRRLLLNAIAALPGDDAMAHLIGRLHEPDVFVAATTAAANFPVRALRRLARDAAAAPADRLPRLAGLAGLIDAHNREHLDETERAVIEALIASNTAVPEADPADLPPLLVAPPWTVKRPKRKAVVVAGLEAPAGTAMVWAEGEREHWAGLRHETYSDYSERQWQTIADRLEGPNRVWIPELAAFAEPDLAARFKDRWDGHVSLWGGEVVMQRLLARYDAEAADRAVAGIAAHHQFTAALLPIRSAAAARLAAERLGLKSTRAQAAAWFDRHGADAAGLLIPDALGTAKALRRNAETALAYIARAAGPDAVRDAAKPYGAEAYEAVSALMDADPLEPVGVKVPKPGTWANAGMLPQVLLAGRATAVPAASVPHLVTVLALGTPELPYPGVDVVAEACDRESLRRFSWALFEQWLAVGAPSQDGWALTQLANFADDALVARLTALIREWPGQSQHKRAITGLQVLGAIGSEAALRAIHGISQKVKFKALKEEAGHQISAVAAGLGLTTDQLADRLVPDFGLGGAADNDGAADDSAAGIVLDYGPRQFRVGFDETLQPFVTDMDGKPRKSLPKPGAKDDETLARAARERFAFLKKELRTVAADLVSRLESAMIEGRTWTAEEFERHFAGHPLVRHLARRLVWTAETGGERTAFRVAEDGTYSDAEDDAFALPADAAIRLAHPILLGDQVAAWAEILADYEILQPFDQLGRPVFAFEPDDLATGRLTRFEGTVVETGRILGMTKRGWERADPADAGMEAGISYRIDRDAYLMVELDPGLFAAAYESGDRQTMREVWLSSSPNFWRGARGTEALARFGELDPVRESEALASLHRLVHQE